MNTYNTSDLALASFLLARGAELLGMSKSKDLKPVAIFELSIANLDLDALLVEYEKSPEKGVLDIQRELKKLIFRLLSTH